MAFVIEFKKTVAVLKNKLYLTFNRIIKTEKKDFLLKIQVRFFLKKHVFKNKSKKNIKLGQSFKFTQNVL